MTPIERILARLPDAKQTSDGYVARCPAHDDQQASLSIREGVDGRVLLKCHARCDTTAVVEKFGLQMRDLFPQKNRWAGPTTAPKPTAKDENRGREYTTDDLKRGVPWDRNGLALRDLYEYTDRQGRPLFAAVRLVDGNDKKTFRQCRSTGPDRWKIGMGTTEPVLYRLPKVLEAAGANSAVYVAEGEKDVHTLEALGFVATTNPMGAGKWRPEYSKCLVGANVVILPDNDVPGRKHAQDVAASCAREQIPVKIVELPGLPAKGDVSDWIAQGHTKEELHGLVQEAPVYVPPADSVAITDDDEPLPPVETPAEPFPIEVFPDPVRRFIEEVSASIPGAPLDYPAGAVLAVAASAIGASRQIELKESYRESAALWVAIVADPGGAKSPALRHVLGPVHEIQRQLTVQHQGELERFEGELLRHQAEVDRWRGEAKKNRVDGSPPVKPQRPEERRIVTSDTTVEALASRLAGNPHGILVAVDELSGWARSHGQYKNGRGADRQHFLSMWSGEPIHVDRKATGTLTVPNPHVCILGGLQPEMLGSLREERHRNDGGLDRFLFVAPPWSVAPWTDAVISPESRTSWQSVVEALYTLQPGPDGPVTIPLSPDAHSRWIELHDEHTAEMGGDRFQPELRGPWSKLKAYAGRLSLVVHLLRVVCGEVSEAEVDERSVVAGWALVDYFKCQARRVYPKIQASALDRRVDRILSWAKGVGGNCRPREVARSGVAGCRRTDKARELLDELVARGHGRWESPQSGKKPSFFILRAPGTDNTSSIGGA